MKRREPCMDAGGSFQSSVFRVQLRREKEKTSADYADYADIFKRNL